MRSALLSVLLLFSCLVLPQSAQPTHSITLEAELSKLAEDAQLLQHDLPSITCTETVLSQLQKKDKIISEVRLAAEVRVERNSRGNLTEHYDFRELNGSPYSGPEPKTPFFVEGSVDEAFLFFQSAVQPLFVFTFSPGRLEYKFREGVNGPQPFMIPPSTHGFALLDAAGTITHIERRTNPKEAERARVTDFASYDFTPTELNGKIYLLSTRNVAESRHGNELRHFEATLSGCRLFHATTTILPGASTIPGEPTPPNMHR